VLLSIATFRPISWLLLCWVDVCDRRRSRAACRCCISEDDFTQAPGHHSRSAHNFLTGEAWGPIVVERSLSSRTVYQVSSTIKSNVLWRPAETAKIAKLHSRDWTPTCPDAQTWSNVLCIFCVFFLTVHITWV